MYTHSTIRVFITLQKTIAYVGGKQDIECKIHNEYEYHFKISEGIVRTKDKNASKSLEK
jgi:hypothetical protein